jgi:hypothetical protein
MSLMQLLSGIALVSVLFALVTRLMAWLTSGAKSSTVFPIDPFVSPEEKPLTIFYRDFGGRIDDLASFLVNGHNQDTPWFVLRSPQVPCPTSAQSNFHNF